MNKLIAISALAVAFICTGCLAPTQSTVKEYDADGKLVKETITSESVVSSLTESTKDKTVILWESGWAAYMSASTATMENPTPTVKMFAGKTDRGLISALPKQNFEKIPEVINATKYELSVTASGVKNTGSAPATESK